MDSAKLAALSAELNSQGLTSLPASALFFGVSGAVSEDKR